MMWYGIFKGLTYEAEGSHVPTVAENMRRIADAKISELVVSWTKHCLTQIEREAGDGKKETRIMLVPNIEVQNKLISALRNMGFWVGYDYVNRLTNQIKVCWS